MAELVAELWLVAGTVILVCSAVSSVGPKHVVNEHAFDLKSSNRTSDDSGVVVNALSVRWIVMDKVPSQPIAKLGVLASVQDEHMPTDVHHRRRCEWSRNGLLGAQL